MSEEYQPKEGDRVLVTLAMVVDGAGQFRAFDHHGGLHHLISPRDVSFVRVEPAPLELPKGFGARIRATVTCKCGDPGSMIPISDVVLVLIEPKFGTWRVAERLPCGCLAQLERRDSFSDFVVLDPGTDAEAQS